MRFYVAASSRVEQIDRVRAFADALVDIGHTATSRWLDLVAAEQAKGFAGDSDLPPDVASRAAACDLNDIIRADGLVLLVPPVGVYSHGAMFEAGYAHGIGKPVYSSGPPRSIFQFRTENYATDYELLEALKRTS